jgi:hypothetical protein
MKRIDFKYPPLNMPPLHTSAEDWEKEIDSFFNHEK